MTGGWLVGAAALGLAVGSLMSDQIGVRIADRLEIRGSRPGRKLFVQQGVIPRVGPKLSDFALLVIKVAKVNSFGGADRLAGGQHIAIANRPARDFRGNLGGANALDAIRAFLHD